MTCIECKQDQGYFRCLDCSSRPLLCRTCCRVGHRRLHTHRIQCWNGKYFRTSALWETGLIFNLCHDGNPCPRLAESEMAENYRQDREWNSTANGDGNAASDGPAAGDRAGESLTAGVGTAAAIPPAVQRERVTRGVQPAAFSSGGTTVGWDDAPAAPVCYRGTINGT